MRDKTPPRPRVHPAVAVLGWICVLLGLLLLAGGLWLIVLGGSWYYALAGIGLCATGLLLTRGNRAAIWVYLVTWLGTLAWAWWEVGSDWWQQVPRLLAPTLILVLVLLCLPALGARRARHPGVPS
ncbi:glucose dehydrogenase [Wenxinia saemankumensis]|uniref:Quinoprotein glucose dehydrogenase n=1 Tax=Wenxinia saemankumensis TaxID=1447782 RepID=A0A1M6HTV9_9RHOB|nr:glucose dehydrogenase [Wenxinia saemankumensis]SHJ25620.1 hypothetical protein SAMN05444417_3358 [Wenxinia saemankumensis]